MVRPDRKFYSIITRTSGPGHQETEQLSGDRLRASPFELLELLLELPVRIAKTTQTAQRQLGLDRAPATLCFTHQKACFQGKVQRSTGAGLGVASL